MRFFKKYLLFLKRSFLEVSRGFLRSGDMISTIKVIKQKSKFEILRITETREVEILRRKGWRSEILTRFINDCG